MDKNIYFQDESEYEHIIIVMNIAQKQQIQ